MTKPFKLLALLVIGQCTLVIPATMARHTQDREDLLREATALAPRFMLQVEIEGQPVEVFAGFRKDAALSIYFNSDPVFHFNSHKNLRRAFVDGRILKADQGKLVAWEPQRTPSIVTMVRVELSTKEQEQFGERMLGMMDQLKNAIVGGRFTLMGQVPEDADGLQRLQVWLDSVPGLTVAASPNVG